MSIPTTTAFLVPAGASGCQHHRGAIPRSAAIATRSTPGSTGLLCQTPRLWQKEDHKGARFLWLDSLGDLLMS